MSASDQAKGQTTRSRPIRWFQDYRNMILLTRWMADNDYSPAQIADAVEKPWTYEAEFVDQAGGTLSADEEARLQPAPDWTLS